MTLATLMVYKKAKHTVLACLVCYISSSASFQKKINYKIAIQQRIKAASNHFFGISIAFVVSLVLCGVTSRENHGVGADAFLPKLL